MSETGVERAYGYDGNRHDAESLISKLVSEGTLSPSAKGMDPRDAFHQHNEANALEPGDREYISTL